MIRFDEIWERILFYVSVPTCVCCKERLVWPEKALCRSCVEKREKMKFHSCSRCGKKLPHCSCSNEYLEGHYIHKLAKVFRYQQRDDRLPVNAPIYSLKRENRNDVLNFLADELAESISNVFPKAQEYIITNVPRGRKSIMKYGIDHGALLAKAVAERIGARYEKLLISEIKTEQKKLYGMSRRLNAKFRTAKERDLTNEQVLIIDDIVTTGSSMGAAAMLIHGMGAKRIHGATLGIAFGDKYKPLIPTEHIKYIRI